MELQDNNQKLEKIFSNEKEEQQKIKNMFRKSSDIKSRKQSCNSRKSDNNNLDFNDNKKIITKDDNPTINLNEITISNYKVNLNERLGKGAFGEIFKGYNILTSESVAIKIESVSTPVPQLSNEYKLLKLLHSNENKSYSNSISQVFGIPKAYYYCNIGNYNFLVLEELGSDLETLLKEHMLANELSLSINKGFSLKTILQIAEQIVSLLIL